jgi:hypothetical protein
MLRELLVKREAEAEGHKGKPAESKPMTAFEALQRRSNETEAQ